MKLIALAVVVLALGIIVGLALRDTAFDRPASAVPQCPGPSAQCPTPTPAPPQQREDQITIWADGGPTAFDPTLLVHSTGDGWAFLRPAPFVVLDTADYPGNARFRFEGTFLNTFPGACLRLYSLVVGGTILSPSGSPVFGSEICSDTDSGTVDLVRSPPVQLPNGEFEYRVQGDNEFRAGDVANAVRIIVEWTE